MNKPIREDFDGEFWQRLVDGQLAPSELRRLIHACEAEPELWKCCAMAFLEEQALSQTLKQSIKELPDSIDWAVEAEEERRVLSPPPLISAAAQPLRLSSSTVSDANPRGDGSSGAGWYQLLSLSALILLAFGIGWQASRRTHQTNSLGAALTGSGTAPVTDSGSVGLASDRSDAAVDVRAPRAVPRALNLAPAQTMLVSDGTAGPARTVRLDDRMPSELDKLSDLEVGRSYGVVPVTLDGVPALVPLERVEIRAREPY